MHSTISRIRLAGLGLAALLATGSIAAAETVQLKADLKGSTPAATGNATVTYDTASKQVTWRITYSGLSGAPTAAHFHDGLALAFRPSVMRAAVTDKAKRHRSCWFDGDRPSSCN